MAEELLAAQILEIRVLHPARAQLLVRQVEGVLENGKARHQSGRQRRHAGAVAVGLAEAVFKKPPVDRPRELHQREIHVDDLIEPSAKQIRRALTSQRTWSP